VGTPKSQLRQFEKSLLEKEGSTEVQAGLEARLIVRTVARPERRVAELLIRLGMELRGRNRILSAGSKAGGGPAPMPAGGAPGVNGAKAPGAASVAGVKM
jgi:hypothetical protein